MSPNFITPDPSKVLIVDISKWQDDPNTLKSVDFELLKERNVSGVIIKCGEANSIDRAFVSYARALETANIPFGVYWYYNNKYSPKIQATLFASTLKNYGISPKLGMWLDLEDRNSGNFTGWKHWYNFLVELKVQFPNSIIGIYTGHYYFAEMTIQAGISASSLEWFNQFPLWIASYGANPKPTKPWGLEWTIWQFTDLLDGKFYGVESKELDGNYFYGDATLFRKFFKLENPTTDKKLIKIIYIYSDGSKEERTSDL